VPTVATIGVYGWPLERFLDALRSVNVGLVLDVRQRRGVRGSEYRERYAKEILDTVDLEALVAELSTDAAAALLCVERDPEACHRSLIAERLAAECGVSVLHLRPPIEPLGSGG
jgi:uncharacterized protein (DUF488 family)